MDAAEIARLRERAESVGLFETIFTASTVIFLLDALEQARKGNAALLAILEDTRVERDTALQSALIVTAQRDQAQKDAKDARALLADILKFTPPILPPLLDRLVEFLA